MTATSLTKADPRPAPPDAGATGIRARSGAHAGRRRLYPLALALLVVVISALLVEDAAWPGSWVVDTQAPLEELNRWLILNRDTHPVFLYFLLHLSNNINSSVDLVFELLDGLGWLGVTALATLGPWAAAGGGTGRHARRAAFTGLVAFAVISIFGMWSHAMLTLALMAVSVSIAAVVGLLLGLAAGLSDRAERMLRPVFDTMQVLPAFAYLLPFVLLFGIGTAPALFATVIYAAPPMARLTALGLRQADPTVMEASRSLGAGSFQQLLTARLPLARTRMLLGLNQTIMMALSMVVIASIIGAGGLGDEVFRGLTTQNIGAALTAGLSIVLIASWLAVTTDVAGRRLENAEATRGPRWSRGGRATLGAAGITVLGWLAGRLLLGQDGWPEGWTVSISEPVNDAVDWVVEHFGSGVPVVGGTLTWAENFTLWVLNPLRDAIMAVPWWGLLLLVGVLANLAGRWRAAATAVASLSVIGLLGVWDKSLDTLSQVIAALLVTLVLGLLTGIVAARVGWFERLLTPLLDAAQTLPQFIYLIPVVALFGVGRIAAIMAAVVYALPAVVRITAQGIRHVDPTVLEASRSLGAGSLQQLRQVQLPLARAQLLLAVNQGVVLVLAVVVVGGLVGGGALGFDTVFGLQRSDLAVGVPAGAALVCLGLMLDRMTQPPAARTPDH